MNTKAVLFIAVVMAIVGAAFLVYFQTQTRLRLLRHAVQERATRLTALQREHERLAKLLLDRSVPAISNARFNELLRLRGEIGTLRRTLEELGAEYSGQPLSRQEVLTCHKEMFWERVNRIKQLFDSSETEGVPELQYMTDTEWLELLKYEPEIGRNKDLAVSLLRSAAQIFFATKVLEDALRNYAKDNSGMFPVSLSELKPYCKPPVDDAVLAHWAILPSTSLPSGIRLEEDWVIKTEQAEHCTQRRFYRGSAHGGLLQSAHAATQSAVWCDLASCRNRSSRSNADTTR